MIEARSLTRRFGELTAVDDLSFAVAPGEVLGFLGPNGAGKTTTMRLLTGFLAPSSGEARVFGHDVERAPRQARAALGYLPEGAPAWEEMTVRELLAFVARVRGIAPAARRVRLDHVVERLGLAPVLDRRIETLSKGFRRRAGLAQAMLHDPAALVLDEPTDGLDPNQKHEVRGLIREMARDKVIIVSTHILEEVEAVCTRAIIIAGGRLVLDDTPQGLAARAGTDGPTAARIDAAFRALTAGAGHA
ncbi:MAG: ABC transporter ATP-binding protein [Steroidobacteraceae bacterium]|jgi:ABC-2 type transport system ATP-binding protein|nr:ABC transporter ATP-binding protein [Steroidobacteraceae bacterium]